RRDDDAGAQRHGAVDANRDDGVVRRVVRPMDDRRRAHRGRLARRRISCARCGDCGDREERTRMMHDTAPSGTWGRATMRSRRRLSDVGGDVTRRRTLFEAPLALAADARRIASMRFSRAIVPTLPFLASFACGTAATISDSPDVNGPTDATTEATADAT